MLTIKDISSEWKVVEGKKLSREFQFNGFLKTMSFVNAIAWAANKMMHHPDMQVSFNKCIVNITTHDADNTLTQKDYLLAKAIDDLMA